MSRDKYTSVCVCVCVCVRMCTCTHVLFSNYLQKIKLWALKDSQRMESLPVKLEERA